MNNRDLPFRSRFCHMTTLDYSMLLMYQYTITLASNIYFILAITTDTSFGIIPFEH